MSFLQRKRFFLFCALTLIVSYADPNSSTSVSTGLLQSDVATTNLFELHRAENEQAVLILYPGFGTSSVETKLEFPILKQATEAGITVLLMNFSQHLWIDSADRRMLTHQLETAFAEHHLTTRRICIGGMSVGGTVAVSLSDHLAKTSSRLAPHCVFLVDSPIDHYALYQSAQKDLLRKEFSEERLAEPRFIIGYFEENFGNGNSLLVNLKAVSPFDYSQGSNSISALLDTKLRFYTEPDSLWWRQNRETDFENINAHVIQQISRQLATAGWRKYELITTEGKGYRANGDRHPHSWSIVDANDLLEWVLD